MESKEYFEQWVVYEHADNEDWDWEEAFDTKKQAVAYMRENNPDGKVRCCLNVDANLGGDEYGYGQTKTEALKNLTIQLKEYGMIPYDPFKTQK